MKHPPALNLLLFLGLAVLVGAPARAQSQGPAPGSGSFAGAAADLERRLEESIAELNALREQIANDTIPQSRQLNELETELGNVRQEFQQASRLLDTRTLDLSNLRTEIKRRDEESIYLSNLLSEYLQKFESRLHIAERQRYAAPLETARLAPENTNLSAREVYEAQVGLLTASLDRLEDALGGTAFAGTAVDASGRVNPGTFVMIGPAAIFRTADASQVGTAENRLGSLEPALIAFAGPEEAVAAGAVIGSSRGEWPLDPTLGSAHKIEATQETLWEHVQMGGPVMVPIGILAGAALLVALYKWLALSFVRRPSRKRLQALLGAVARNDAPDAVIQAKAMGGPAGRMLSAGVEHLDEPRELIEEVMYETILTTRLKLLRFLPFIAICAASAPLLGLLGTVTGIINTFKLITVFGSGDVKTLSSGISEALITTEYGLIVAIPSLLLHAFLSRKAKNVIDRMEMSAMAFLNQVGKVQHDRSAAEQRRAGRASRSEGGEPPDDGRRKTTDEVKEILAEPLAPAVAGKSSYSTARAE